MMFDLKPGLECLARSAGCRNVTMATLGSGKYFNTTVTKSPDERVIEHIEIRCLFLQAAVSTIATLAYRVIEFSFNGFWVYSSRL